MLNLPELIGAVQRNCDISDAQHARTYGMCTYLLKMREYYRWEHQLPYFHRLPKEDLGSWLDAREALWERLESSHYTPLPLDSGELDPFETADINSELVPRGIVYSGGFGRFRKPHFFLGELLRREEREGFEVLISTCEYARDLTSPPAMLQHRTIFVRMESVERFIWEKYEQWKWNQQNAALARAFACHDFESDSKAALERMAQDEAETMVLHELGEGRAGKLLGVGWEDMLAAVAGTKAEIIARAVRDNLADCLSTLPALIAQTNHASLHFYFGNFDGMRAEIFPAAKKAYAEWAESGDIEVLARVAEQGRDRWQDVAHSLMHDCSPGQQDCFEELVSDTCAASR